MLCKARVYCSIDRRIDDNNLPRALIESRPFLSGRNMEFVLGQRWISQTETELGLGIVVEIEGRNVTVRFPVAEEDRVYAQSNSPLARVLYQAGDTLHDQAQEALRVEGVEDLDGLQCYLVRDAQGTERVLPETQISGLIHLSTPRQRLLSGQFGKAREYQLRVASLHHRHQLQQSEARGLLGTRTSLLPHQVYIAHEVASRYAPRVLLADEVGLGKTIEAGMIVHHQLQTGLASRVLIVVPDALLHQWLVEMLRKFGLRFALFDQERFEALQESDEGNPFDTEQLVLCGLSLFVEQHNAVALAADSGWDLLVVDEAHHLQWSEREVSQEYAAIEQLAQYCEGLLLLTATPEQLGRESHFARLRLLDPSRFSDLHAFFEEQQGYVALNEVVHKLLEGHGLSPEQQQLLGSFVDVTEVDQLPAPQLINQLLDRHGTGRVLFRNTRNAVAGFPQRILHGYALAPDEDHPAQQALYGLHPEQQLRAYASDWVKLDPRVKWLEEFFKGHRQDKVLVICAAADTAVDLEHHLHLNVGIRSAAFYEDLSIVERDRAAAYFADEEIGAQVLICSEIGSEGRNFQFAHHLVLFDLPTNPDLLEQRIGRLDRIGQTEDVKLHVPYVAGGAQAALFRWFDEGMDAFCHSFSAGAAVLERFAEPLQDFLNGQAADTAAFDELVTDTAAFTQALRQELQQGRDALLELNSCKPEVADQVIDAIKQDEQSDAIQAYIEQACEVFGVDPEFHSEHSLILRPTEQMMLHSFPYVGEDGLTVTFNRDRALVREDMEFITWESPITSEVMDMVLGSELGNTNIGTIKLKVLPAGTLLVECFYAMRCSAPRKYQIGRFLPETVVRVLLDSTGRDLTNAMSHEQLNSVCAKVPRTARTAIVKEIRGTLAGVLDRVEQQVQAQNQPLIDAATTRIHEVVGGELNRLRDLARINPSIRDVELAFLEQQQQHALEYVAQAALEPQAIRVVIAT